MNKTYEIKGTVSDRIFDGINMGILCIVLSVVLIPLLFIINASLSDPNEVLNGKVLFYPVGFTLEGYSRVFSEPKVWQGYWNVVLYAVVGTSINLVMTILGAYPLSRKDFRGGTFFMLLITFTMFFSGGMIPAYILVRELGIYNSIWAIVLPPAVGVWNLIIAKTYFQISIPDELKEAAQIDGCNNVRFLLKIVIPLSLPILAVLGLFYGVAHWNNFMRALLYLSDESKYPLQIVLRQILLQNQISGASMDDITSAVERQKLSLLLRYSLIIVASAPLLIIYPFLQRFFVKGMLIGAIKG
jgi:putative aldouronate transport system permease protein